MVVDGLVLHQAQAFVRAVVPGGAAVTADKEAAIVATVDGLVQRGMEAEGVAVGMNIAADVACAPGPGHRVALALVEFDSADVDDVGRRRVDVHIAGEGAVQADRGAVGAQLPGGSGRIGGAVQAKEAVAAARHQRVLVRGAAGRLLQADSARCAASRQAGGQLRERGAGRQRVGALVDAAAPERRVHRVAGAVAAVDEHIRAGNDRGRDRRQACAGQRDPGCAVGGSAQAPTGGREGSVGVAAIHRDAVEAVVREQGGGMERPVGAAIGAAQHAHPQVDAGSRAQRVGGAVELHVAFAGAGVQHVGVVGAQG